MGETTIYSQREQAYLKAWLGKMQNPSDAEELFKQGFLSGSLQNYEKSILEKTLMQLKNTQPTQEDAPIPAQELPPAPRKEHIEQEKMQTIERMLARWLASDKHKQVMYLHLKEQHPMFVSEIAKNPQRNEVLAKLFSSL
jgi:hypothetical protein